jgi:hypothetical protein
MRFVVSCGDSNAAFSLYQICCAYKMSSRSSWRDTAENSSPVGEVSPGAAFQVGRITSEQQYLLTELCRQS